MPEQPTRMTTRSKNANQHPGVQAEGQKRKRRTKAEMAIARAEEVERKATKTREKAKKIERIAQLEAKIAEDNATEIATPRPTNTNGRQIRRTYAQAVVGESDIDSNADRTSDANFDLASNEQPSDSDGSNKSDNSSEAETQLVKKKAKQSKPKIREAVNAARSKIDQGGAKMVVDENPLSRKRVKSKESTAKAKDGIATAHRTESGREVGVEGRTGASTMATRANHDKASSDIETRFDGKGLGSSAQ